MSDFNYDIQETTKYTLESATLDGNTTQASAPTPDDPVDVVTLTELDDGNIYLETADVSIPIDLLGNELVKLPNNVCDVLTVDENGNVTITKKTGKYTVSGQENFVSRAYGDYWKIVLSSAIANHPSVPVTLSTGWCDYAPFIGNVSSQELHAYTTTTAITFFEDLASAQDVFDDFIGATVYYQLATEYDIEIGAIDISQLKDLETELPISFNASLEGQSAYSYTSKTTYEVLNPYEDSNAPEYAYPPNHPGMEWETFDANDWSKADMMAYTGQMESHAVYTVELCELMESGAFDWSRPEIDWSEAAYSAEQYERFCKYFESRFMFREISIIPPLEWFNALRRMLVFELMPKYSPMYAQIENGISPLGENEYLKRRHITSNYPETLLSGNSDYITTGDDEEYERIKIDNAAQALKEYREGFSSVDKAIGDELEVLFVSMYTSYVNGL